MISETLMERLNSFLALKDDWDSYGSFPITSAAVGDTAFFIDEAKSEIEGDVGPLPNGGIDIEWEIGEDSLLVEISPDGTIVAWAMRKDGVDTCGTYDGDIQALVGRLRSQTTR